MSHFAKLSATLAFSILAATSVFANEVEVKGARLDSTGENLLVEVVHGGGCEKHVYKLVPKACAESMPVQCEAEVKDLTFDTCESFVQTTVSFNLKAHGYVGRYYSNG